MKRNKSDDAEVNRQSEIVYRFVQSRDPNAIVSYLKSRRYFFMKAARTIGLNSLDAEIAFNELCTRLVMKIRNGEWFIDDPWTCSRPFNTYASLVFFGICKALIKANSKLSFLSVDAIDPVRSTMRDPQFQARVVQLLLPLAMGLPEAQRNAFVGVFRLGMSESELAEFLGVKPQTVSRNLQSAIARLTRAARSNESLRNVLDQLENFGPSYGAG